METATEGGILFNFAEALGASENSLRLIISLLLGYPLGFFHRYALYARSPTLQHLYFTGCSMLLCYFNFGSDVVHSLINIVLMYAVLLCVGGTSISIILAYTLNMGYLCWGYWVTSTADQGYEVKWTTPQCVLTLRLIGLAYDVYDGRKKPEQLSKEQKETALQEIPSLLEVLGHSYFVGGFLVGPQFPMRRYLDFVNGAYSDPVTGGKPHSVGAGLTRLVAGLGYTAVYQISQIYFPDSYLNSQDFYDSGFFSKCLFITLWGKFTCYKYVAAWVITEGVCILTGLTYNGHDENGNSLWDACRNIYIRQLEAAATLQDMILAFNVNTNRWMAKYVYKRLKFVGSVHVSQAATLFFLAIWHGYASGYFMNFFLEFIMINFEKGAQKLLSRVAVITTLAETPYGAVVFYAVKKVYSHFCLSYALVSFCLLDYNNYLATYAAVWFLPHVILLVWPLVFPTLYRAVGKSSPREAPTQDGGQSNNMAAGATSETTAADKKEL